MCHRVDRVTAYISIHALLAESDIVYALKLANAMLFLSTLSLRRATPKNPMICIDKIPFLSTLSLRRATTYFDTSSIDDLISIHALLAESDLD